MARRYDRRPVQDAPVRVPDEDGCDCEECVDCAHSVCVVGVEAWLAGVILAQTGVGQTGFEGNVPGEDIDETVAMLIREMAKEARSTLRRLAALAASYPPPGAPALDADDMSVTRASRHLPGDLDAGLMPGTELGGVQVTAHRRHEPGQQGSSRVGAVRLAPGARTLSPAVACVAD